MKKILIVMLIILSGCSKTQKEPEAIETSVYQLVQEAKELGIDGKEINSALDGGVDNLRKMIAEKKK